MFFCQYVTKGAYEKGTNEQNENISSKSDDFDHFTTRKIAFYVIFDVVDFLSTFNFSIARKTKFYKKINDIKNGVKRSFSCYKIVK